MGLHKLRCCKMYAVYMYGLVLLVVIEMYHVGLPAALESIRTTSAFTVTKQEKRS